jgi:hypothetical protein
LTGTSIFFPLPFLTSCLNEYDEDLEFISSHVTKEILLSWMQAILGGVDSTFLNGYQSLPSLSNLQNRIQRSLNYAAPKKQR